LDFDRIAALFEIRKFDIIQDFVLLSSAEKSSVEWKTSF
jgi:hypothetical protein